MAMRKDNNSRRSFIVNAAVTTGLVAANSIAPTRFAIGAKSKIRVGILLPYSGTYAMLGNSITNAMKMRIEQAGGRMGGRLVEYVALDSEMSVPKAPQNINKLIKKEKVNFLVGPVHSGIAAAMAKIMGQRRSPIMIVPNAGSNAVTGQLCAPNIFRTSFSNWQPAFPGGILMGKEGHKTCVTISWKYGAGIQMMDAGRNGFITTGGKSIKDILLPFPNVEFQAHLSEIAALKPDCVFAFFSGGGAIKFLKDYEAAGLKDKIPLYGPGFLTEGVEKAAGSAAEGIMTTLHYASNLDNSENHKFRANYKASFGTDPDVFSVQGYDTGSLLLQATAAVGGDVESVSDVIEAMETSRVPDSPRGPWSMSKAHNPIQNIYLRQVEGGQQKFLGIAAKALADPATGCKMG
jgi:branched-chain amino acid transport system substrate-binding protein